MSVNNKSSVTPIKFFVGTEIWSKFGILYVYAHNKIQSWNLEKPNEQIFGTEGASRFYAHLYESLCPRSCRNCVEIYCKSWKVSRRVTTASKKRSNIMQIVYLVNIVVNKISVKSCQGRSLCEGFSVISMMNVMWERNFHVMRAVEIKKITHHA